MDQAKAYQEAQQLLAMIETLEASGRSDEVPQDIRDLLANVKRGKGEAVDEQPTQEIIPEPGFVVKTVDEDGRKVFLNICGSDKVDSPGDWKQGQMPEDLQEKLEQVVSTGQLPEEGFEGLRFPLSCGTPRIDIDRLKEPCTVLDVVFNGDVVKQSSVCRPLKLFVIQVAMDWAGSKFKMTLDPMFKLPKMRYKGSEIEPQYIRGEKKQLVKEVKDVEEDPVFPLVTKKRPQPPPQPQIPARSTSTPAADTAPAKRTHHETPGSSTAGSTSSTGHVHDLSYTVSYPDKPVSTMVVVVQLPSSLSLEQSDVAVNSLFDQVRIEVKQCRPLTVKLPLAVDQRITECSLTRDILELKLGVRAMSDVVEQLRRDAPHEVGTLSFANNTYLELDD